ncbi:MAG: transcription antitermination factor NusB [Desulfobulbaceae bacterium]|nr:MAG: transcription antitermination factor NusB [Desulfobulbaceae bacterium]
MGTRRKAREATLQFLFQDDFNDHQSDLEIAERFQQFCGLYQISHKARPYALKLLDGVKKQKEQVDRIISRSAKNWRLERIAVTDRNLLRVGVYEMLFVPDVPDQVAINEAVEIAKRFGSSESPAFINGVLDAVRAHPLNIEE